MSRWFLPAFIVVFTCGYIILMSDVVQDKINNESSASLISRQSDNLAMFQMVLEEPFIGWGLGSVDHLKRSDALGNWSNSNGILYMTSSVGIPWLILYLAFLCIGIYRLGFRNISLLFVLLAFLMMESNEKFIEHPVSYILLFYREKNILNSIIDDTFDCKRWFRKPNVSVCVCTLFAGTLYERRNLRRVGY